MWLALLLACGAEPVEGVVWGGWTYRWDMLSHRVSYLRVEATPEGGASLGLVGGDWSTGETFTDAPQYRLRATRARSDAWTVVQGETELLLGPDGALSTTELVDDAELLSWPEHAVLLRGFTIDTDVEQGPDYPEDYDPAYGYTSRGFGFGVGAPASEADGLAFEVEAEVRWAPQDREDMNAAIPYASTGVRVAWTAIGFAGARDEQEFSASATWADATMFTPQPAFGAEELPLSLGAGTPAGLAGLTRFDLRVDAQDGSEDGEYLRSFGVELVEGDEEPGAFEGHARAEITNSSLLETAEITSSVSGSATWVGLDDARAALEPLVMVGAHAVGALEVGPAEAP